MDDYIAISTLNDFLFCPYSIYLHNVYMESDEGVYHAAPQSRGRMAHESIDAKTASSRKADIISLPVASQRLHIMGKIDLYRQDKKLLVERKYQLKRIFKGHYYQLWAQYLCLTEMGYEVEQLAFYETSTNRTIAIPLPTTDEMAELEDLVGRFRAYSPNDPITLNPNKCLHCIYCNLCDKTYTDNVYS